MKRIVIAIVIVLAAVGIGVGYSMMSGKGPAAKAVSQPSGYMFAKPEPITVTGTGGVQLPTVDLGDGPVPLLQLPLDTWGGYAGVFAANKGLKPNKDSFFYQKGKFAVELVNEESASKQLSGYASGKWPIIWAPMDSLPLLYDALKTDKRVAPKVLGLFDWSSGGDGIIARNSIKRPTDLKDRVILTSSNTPYSFLLLWYLAQVGLTGNDVKVVWVDDGEKALQMFKSDKNIAAWVTWSPYLKDVTNSASSSYVPDTRLLISSKDTNQLIADTFIVRADFFAENQAMLQAFVEAIIEGSQTVDTATYNSMMAFYKLKSVGEAKDMLADVHLANFPETKMFFDPANTIGAYKVFALAQEYYSQLGVLPASASYDPERVISTDIVAAIEKKGIYKGQKNGMMDTFTNKAAFDIADLENQRVILANDIKIYFEAQKLDFDVKSSVPEIVKNMKMLHDVSDQTKVLATSMVKLIGHLDTGKVEEFKAKGAQAFAEASAQAKLTSKKRAEFIKKVLVEQYGVDPDRIVTEGRGWNSPIEGAAPEENRRVEAQFISLE